VTPKRIKYIAPEYPKQALIDGIQGWVDVSFLVTATGDVRDVKIEGASKRQVFDRAAIQAVRGWKFEPLPVDDPGATRLVKTRVEFKIAE
jgi:protein TonB